MPSNRVVSSFAIAFGGLLGTLAALLGRNPAEPPGAEKLPFTPVGRTSPMLEVTPAAATATEALPAAASAVSVEPPPAAPRAPDAPPISGETAVKQAELDCARGDGVACLAAGEAHQHGRGVAADAERARMLTALGVQRFATRCMARVPGACLELAKLHASGRGVSRDQRAADALVDRATMLCAAKPEASGCPGAPE